MKTCEVCGISEGKILGKTGKFKKDLCVKHYNQITVHGNILERSNKDCNKIIVLEDYAEIICFGKDNRPNGTVKIDIEDIEKARSYKWHIVDKTSPVSTVYLGKVLPLARLLFGCIKKQENITYKNKDILDCRKCNLMVGSKSEIQHNAKTSKRNTSGYKGVSWDKYKGRWVAQIRVNYKQCYLGRFTDINDAIAARKVADDKYFGDFAYDASRDVTLKHNV